MGTLFSDVVSDKAWFHNEIKALDMREGTKMEKALSDISWVQLKSFCINVFNDDTITKIELAPSNVVDYSKLLLKIKYNDSYTVTELIELLSVYKL